MLSTPMLRILGILGVCLVVIAACQEEEPVSPEPGGQEGCAGHNEAQCAAPCTVIKSRRPRSDDLEFMECIATEVQGSTAVTCGLSPDQSECRIFPTTRIAIEWRETPCTHPLCSELDAGLDAAVPWSDASSHQIPDSSMLSDADAAATRCPEDTEDPILEQPCVGNPDCYIPEATYCSCSFGWSYWCEDGQWQSWYEHCDPIDDPDAAPMYLPDGGENCNGWRPATDASD